MKTFTIDKKPVSAEDGNGVWIVVNDKVENAKKNGWKQIIKSGYDISKAKLQLNPKQYTKEAVVIDRNDDFKKRELKGVELSLEGAGQNIEIIEGSYINNLKKGTAKVTIRGIGEYGGIKTVTFKIGARSIVDSFDEMFMYWK